MPSHPEQPSGSPARPAETDTIDRWLEVIQHRYQRLFASERPIKHIDIFFLMAWQLLLKSTEHWSDPGRRREFQLTAALFLLRTADRFYAENHVQFPHHYLWSAVKDSADRIIQDAVQAIRMLRLQHGGGADGTEPGRVDIGSGGEAAECDAGSRGASERGSGGEAAVDGGREAASGGGRDSGRLGEVQAEEERFPGRGAERFPERFAVTLHEAAFRETDSPVDLSGLYRAWWQAALCGPDAVQAETGRLQQVLSERPPSSKFRQLAATLLIERYVAEDRDEEAAALLRTDHSLPVKAFQEMLKQLHDRREWRRLHHWLRLLLPLQKRASGELFQACMQYWKDTCSALGLKDELPEVYAALLPRSYYHYTRILLETGQEEKWANFHLLNEVPPSALHPAELKQLEEYRPDLLLPLYHQAVERSIQQKNRSAYREAAAHLRKLQECYRRMNRPEAFRLYVEQLQQAYGRMRALQEELRKGKLLT